MGMGLRLDLTGHQNESMLRDGTAEWTWSFDTFGNGKKITKSVPSPCVAVDAPV